MNSSLRSSPLDVVFALVVREMRTRAGNRNVGYLLAIAEPVLHVAVLLFLLGQAGRALLPGIDMAAFFAVGVVHFLLLRALVDRVGMAFVANKPLLFYRQVQPVYTSVARAIVEMYVHIGVLAVLGAFAFLFEVSVGLSDVGRYLTALLLLAALGLGWGLLVASVAAIAPNARLVSTNLMRGLYFISCVFYPLVLAPGGLKQWLVLNPIVHALESLRAGLIPNYALDAEVSLGYLGVWALVSLALGLVAYRIAQPRLGSV